MPMASWAPRNRPDRPQANDTHKSLPADMRWWRLRRIDGQACAVCGHQPIWPSGGEWYEWDGTPHEARCAGYGDVA